MGSLLAVLHLSPPKALRLAATADPREMEMIEDKGARWVDREVDEREIAAFMAGAAGRIDKPAANTRLERSTAPPADSPV